MCRTTATLSARSSAGNRTVRRPVKGPVNAGGPVRKPTRDYFRGDGHVQRVQEWRKAHPGYWRKKKSRSQGTQSADSEGVNPEQGSCNALRSLPGTLQDLCLTEHPAFVGLSSMVTGCTLQEDIAATGRKLILRGSNILGLKIPVIDKTISMIVSHDSQTIDPSGSPPPSAAQLQLD